MSLRRTFFVLLVLMSLTLSSSIAWTLPKVLPATPDALMIDGVAYVPVRPLAAWVGGQLKWDKLLGVVCIVRNGKKFACVPDYRPTRLNHKPVNLEPAPFMHLGYSYVPLRALVNTLGGSLKVNTADNTVTVSFPGSANRLQMPLVKITANDTTENDQEIFVMDLDGSALQRLTFDRIDDDLPAFAPDGTWLVNCRNGNLFMRSVDNPYGRCLLDTSETAHIIACEEPQISPDGQQILYTQLSGEDTADSSMMVCSVHKDGTDQRTLAKGMLARWSPKGDAIAFTDAQEKDNPKFCVMSATGDHLRQLGQGIAWAFGPDGQSLMYIGWDSAGNPETQVNVCHTDNPLPTEAIPVDSPLIPGEFPGAFSPDGRSMVLSQHGKGICIMSLDRSTVHQVTNESSDGWPVFTADGSHIIFLRDRALYSAKTDGTDLCRLTKEGIYVTRFSLTPDGKRITFSAMLPPVTCASVKEYK